MSYVTDVPAADSPPPSRISRHRCASRPIAGTCTTRSHRARPISCCSTCAAPISSPPATCPAPATCRAARSSSKLAGYPAGTLFVVCCAGCNGAARAAIQLARLGRPVKLMIGGVTGWLDEGFALSN